MRRLSRRSNLGAFVTSLAVVVLVTGCGKNPERQSTWPDGTVKETFRVKISKEGRELRDGPYRSWNEAGYLTTEGKYVDGEKDGPWTYWFGTEPNKKQQEGTYVAGRKEGVWSFWMPPGDRKARQPAETPSSDTTSSEADHLPPQKQQTYVDGVANGLFISWHPDGTVADSMYYVDGLLEGRAVTYHGNGHLAKRATYEKGVLVGEQEVFTAQGAQIPQSHPEGDGH